MSSMSFKRVVQQSPIVTCTEPTLQLAHVHPRKDSYFFLEPQVMEVEVDGSWEPMMISGFQLGDFLGDVFFSIGKCPVTLDVQDGKGTLTVAQIRYAPWIAMVTWVQLDGKPFPEALPKRFHNMAK